MNINIKGTNIELTEAIQSYVDKRLQSLEKFLGGDPAIQCDVEVKKTTQHHKHGDIFRAEIHIVGSNKNIYVAAEESDLYAAIDRVRDEAMHRLTSSKDKKVSLARRSGAKVKDILKGMFRRD